MVPAAVDALLKLSKKIEIEGTKAAESNFTKIFEGWGAKFGKSYQWAMKSFYDIKKFFGACKIQS